MMRRLLPLALVAAATARAQEAVTYTLGFTEVLAGTATPVASPNGLIEPGEGARIAVTVTIAPGVGSPVTYTPPPGPGSGTLAALGSIFFDLNQSGAMGGTWAATRRAQGWALGTDGFANGDGSYSTATAGQFVLPGSTPISDNPVDQIWRGTWTPSTYTPRTVTFTSTGAAAAGQNHTSILVYYGVDPDGNPAYAGVFVPGIFGAVHIPVVPAPPILPAAACACAFLRPRRRTRP